VNGRINDEDEKQRHGDGDRYVAERTQELQQQDHQEYHGNPQDGDDVAQPDEPRRDEPEGAGSQVASEPGNETAAADDRDLESGLAVAAPLQYDAPDRNAHDGPGGGVHSLMSHHVEVLRDRPEALGIDDHKRCHSEGRGVGSRQVRLGNTHAIDVKA
jgi:hypothetical protein